MLDWGEVRRRANEDGACRLHSRCWSSRVRLDVGDDQHTLTVAAGEVTDIEPWFGAVAANLSIAAPREDWDALLESVPRPFYQDLYPATVHHGFEVTGDTAHFCAYYPAIRRLIEIMREVNNAQV